MRAIWLACCVLVPALVMSIPTVAITAIWVGSGRLGGVAVVVALTAVPIVPLFWIWTEDKRPQQGLPRSVRKTLRAEQARIALDAAIAKAEREAGL